MIYNTTPKILWLSPTPGLFYNEQKGYGTGGWIASLQKLLVNSVYQNHIAICFLDDSTTRKVEKDGFVYYLIRKRQVNSLKKLFEYYTGGRKYRLYYIDYIKTVIEDFHPDLIHIFGAESQLSQIIGHTQIPIVVHLQGILSPISNAFLPPGFSKNSFLFPFSMREWVLRNGFIYSYNDIKKSSLEESLKFKRIGYFMGRTEFDFRLSKLFSPTSQYFKVNEVLRDEFYNAIGTWNSSSKEFVIVSTLSNTVYKGLDLVLKTACLLKKESSIDYVWKIVGVNKNDRIVRIFESKLGIESECVNVSYEGIKNAGSLVEILRNCSMYVHPSYIDNSPNSICEAQLIGVPVVACDVGGVSSLVSDNNGVLVPANSPYELAYHIITLSTDIVKLGQLGIKGKECAIKRHNKEEILLNLLNSYELIVGQNV